MKSLGIGCGVWLLLGVCGGAPLRAQTVVTITPLRFGTVLAGTTEIIPPTDSRAGQFRLDGPRGRTVQISFSLPASLTGSGAAAPLSFTATSGLHNHQNRTAGALAFDPRQGTQFSMPNNQTVYIWIGAQFSPPRAAPAGVYSAVITLSVSFN